jgi:hypothetical protein
LRESLAQGETRPGWKIGWNTTDTFYEWLDDPAHAQAGEIAHRFFEAQFQGIPSWLDDISFKDTYEIGVRPEDVVFVDVGGGKGQESKKLKDKVLDLVGRVIHQDLPGPLERAPKIEGVQQMAYDYFGVQPVKGEAPRSTNCLFVNRNSQS